uniref:sphingomyelin phosphodiesterase n=1 Tax=Ditylenchus dipsaci TaxID=166011 RepID=A0A915DL19_9BILA
MAAESKSQNSSLTSSNENHFFKIATLNCWAIPQPWPIGSKHRKLRIGKLIEALGACECNYDVVTLQELWSEDDFLLIAHQVAEKYPYSHYFHSGFTGSGTAIISQYPITSTLLHRYSLNGFAHHIHRGDWFGGKIVGMAEVTIGDLKVSIYTTHLHAEYNRKNDLYLPHRISQCYELAQFVRHTSLGADFVVLTGDFNIEPNDLGYHLVVNIAQLSDAWECRPNRDAPESFCAGMTCDRPDNCFTSPSVLKDSPQGKRLDYIMFQSRRVGLEVKECKNCFGQIESMDKPMNYSDHDGLCATFLMKADPPTESSSDRRSQSSVDRRLFLALCFILFALLVATLNIESSFPYLFVVVAIIRFVSTFSLWHGFIGLTIEMKALKETKFSMRKILRAIT